MTKTAQEIRLFFAIDLPDQVKSFLKEVISQLKSAGGDVKWVEHQNIHITLKFLGNVAQNRVSQMEQSVERLFSFVKPFELRIAKVGAFPSLGKPRIIWAGLTPFSDTLARLASDLEEKLEPLGFQRENRPFHPHLTLGRVRSPKGSASLIETIRQRMDLAGPSFQADHAILFQSILKPSGAEYIPVRCFDFKAE